jgi:hypothetical protein
MNFKVHTNLKIVIFTLVLCLFNQNAKAQSFEHILVAGKEDASRYLGDYMEPVFKGLITNLNSGWYHSGKTHKLLGFDITLNATVSIVPKKDKTFLFNNTDYTVLALNGGATSSNLPSVMGKETTQKIDVIIPNTDINGVVIPNEFKVATFDALNGIEGELPIAAIPSPMVQFGIGLPTKTDLKIRFIPNVGNKDVKYNLIGIGFQHNLLQHFLKLDKVPIVDLSILGAYTNSTVVYNSDSNLIPGSNQETTIKVNAYTAQLVGNVNLKVINFYAGLGYTAGDASIKIKGTYDFSYDIQDNFGNTIGNVTETVTDPIDIDYKMASGVKATIGMRLNMAWFKFFADYSIQEYNTINAGIAFSFR